MSMIIPGAAFCGFVAQQAMMIAPAVKKDEASPDTFSWRYYFSRPANVIQLVINGSFTLGLMLAHSEVIGLMGKIPVVGPYFDGEVLPTLTGLLIGFCGGFLARWIAYLMAKAQ